VLSGLPTGPPRARVRLSSDEAGRSLQPLGPINAAGALAWVALVVFAFGFAPGEVGSSADTDLVMALIANPTAPMDGGVSPIFACLFNLFLPVPLMLAALLLPTSTGQRLPALPFVLASLFVGYFSLGPYLVLRSAPPADALGDGDARPFGFLDSRLFAAAIFALTCSIPISAQLLQVIDWSAGARDFAQLFSSSRLVSVSCIDLSVLCVALALLVREDAGRRGLGQYAAPLCVASLLLPAFAPAVWMLARPPLPADE
jgi:hypothetical protein